MENKKGNSIFLGIVSVATLIVAIIGATFAYFSTSTSSANNAVSVEAYQFAVSMTAEKIAPTSKGLLIPFDPMTEVNDPTHEEFTTNMTYALNVGKDGSPCIADGGYQVCALYKLSFSNGVAGAAETLEGRLVGVNSTAGIVEHLKIQHVTYDETNGYTLSGDAIDVSLASGWTEATRLGTVTAYNEPGEGQSNDYYFVLWLDEADDANDTEQGGKFDGEFVFSSTAGNQLTGTFTITG